MRSYFFVVLSVFLLAASGFADDVQYSKIRISLNAPDDLNRLGALGLAVEEGTGKRGRWIDLFVSADERARVQASGFAYTVLIDDWKQFYEAQQRAEQEGPAAVQPDATVKNFHLGTMKGCLTYSAVLAELDSMKSRYPSLITARESIGGTYEKRALWMAKISKNPAVAENEPRVLYTALHHAREGAGMMQLIYFMWYLLENYGSDADVTSLLDHRELFFVPVVNPDGYSYNQTTNPTGNGMWRKNRFQSSPGVYGIDLNRNYDYQWGYDNTGSSPVPSDDTYRGVSGFSEFETQAIRNLCDTQEFSAALNYHTYGNLLIFPWGFSDADTKDSLMFRQFGDEMTSVNHYNCGTGSQTVGYVTNGDSDDWMYGDTKRRGKIFSMTPEIGNDADGFWPLTTRILPLAQENVTSDLYLAHVAGKFVTITGTSVAQETGNDTLTISLSLADKGLVPASGQVELTSSSDLLHFLASTTVSDDWKSGVPIQMRAVRTASSGYGSAVTVQCFLRYDGELTRDSITFRIGVPQTLFSDDGGSERAQWTASTKKTGFAWDTTSRYAHSGRTSYSQSQTANYPDLLSTTFTLNRTFHLDGVAAELRFWLKWNTEANYDFAYIEVSSDNGTTWTAQTGKYSGRWNSTPSYFGVRYSWVEEVIDLTAYLGKDVNVRFRFTSDDAIHYDGIYVDDVVVNLYPKNYDGVEHTAVLPVQFSLEQNFPNPFNPSTDIRYTLPAAEHVVLKVYDVLGREVAALVNGFQNPGSHIIHFDGAHLSSGTYIVRLSAGEQAAVVKMVLVQ